jgi:hypothetical protein
MLSLAAAILATATASFGPTGHAVTVPGYSWADGPSSWLEAPGCLVRAEVWEAGASGRMGGADPAGSWTDDGSVRLSAAGPLGGAYAGASAAAGLGAVDTLSASLAGAWLVTGDPVSFMEGFFGPSVSVGASLGARSVSGDDDSSGEILAAASAQVALFPTFCLGAGTSGYRLAGWGDEGLRSEDAGGELAASCTYIFGRRLRGHLGFGAGGPSAGADLRVSDGLLVMTGTDGDHWSVGARAEYGRLSADYSLRLTAASAAHAGGISLKLGDTSW